MLAIKTTTLEQALPKQNLILKAKTEPKSELKSDS